MSRYKIPDNPYRIYESDGNRYIVFQTVGKNRYEVLVDEQAWKRYLSSYSWTAIKDKNRITVKTSINKQSQSIWRVIIEHEYNELDYWGTTIDHINNNPLDNRLENLRIFNAAILNNTNISSKYEKSGMQYIHRMGSEEHPTGYKIHYNIAGETFYKNFSVAEYGGVKEAINAAKEYRDDVVMLHRDKVIKRMLKKTRDIEFERGLRDKLDSNEKEEVLGILRKYGII